VTSAARRPEEIEAEIARTRAGLGDTLGAIEDRLAPRQFLEKGIEMIRNGGDVGRIGQILKDNPIPLALIGAGLGWLMLSQTGAGRQIGSAAADAAGAVGERVRGLVGRGEGDYAHAWTKREDAARRAAADMPSGSAYGGGAESPAVASRAYGALTTAAGRALDTAGDYAGGAGRQLGEVRDRFGQLMEEHPLAVGALGFLAGAVIAAALPSTQWEDEHLGETRDDLWREAQAAGQEMAEKAREVASTAASAASDAARQAVEQTTEAVRQEAERQGLPAGEEQKG
jgi:hypothetical protein